MDLTIQRTLCSRPERVWAQLTDLSAAVRDDPTLELVDVDPGPSLARGRRAVVTRRIGRQVRTFTLTVRTIDVDAGRLTADLDGPEDRWELDLTVAPDPDDDAQHDVTLTVRRQQPTAPGRGGRHRAANDVIALLEAWARSLDEAERHVDA